MLSDLRVSDCQGRLDSARTPVSRRMQVGSPLWVRFFENLLLGFFYADSGTTLRRSSDKSSADCPIHPSSAQQSVFQFISLDHSFHSVGAKKAAKKKQQKQNSNKKIASRE